MDEANNDSVVEILRSYDYEGWLKWIMDITEHKIAFPISNLSANGDVLVEIIDLLRKNSISVFHYERALSDSFAKEYKQNINNYNLQERYLNALAYLSSNSCIKTLVEVLDSKVNSHHKGRTAYIKTLALLALFKASNIEEKVSEEILDYIKHRGIYEMTHDVYFYSTALRFCYRKVSVAEFFFLMTKTLHLDFAEEQQDRLIHLLVDKIDELFYYKPYALSKNIKIWLVNDFGYDKELILLDRPLSRKLLIEISALYRNNEIRVDPVPDQSNEIKLEEATIEFFLSILLNQDVSSKGIMSEENVLITILKSIVEDEKVMKFCSSIMENNRNYITEDTKLRIVYAIIERRFIRAPRRLRIFDPKIEQEHEPQRLYQKIYNVLVEVFYNPSNQVASSPEKIHELLNVGAR